MTDDEREKIDTLTDEQMARIAEAHGWCVVLLGAYDPDGETMATVVGVDDGWRLTDAGARAVLIASGMTLVSGDGYMVYTGHDDGQGFSISPRHPDPNHAVALAELARLDAINA